MSISLYIIGRYTISFHAIAKVKNKLHKSVARDLLLCYNQFNNKRGW